MRLLTKQPVDREEANLLLAELWAKVGPVASASASASADLDALRAAVTALQAQAAKTVFTPDIWNAIRALADAEISALLGNVTNDQQITGAADESLTQEGQKLKLNTLNQTVWQALQIWAAGGYIGGQCTSDMEPEYTVISGKGAYPGATAHLVGGNLVLSGGYGQSSITVTDWTKLYGGQVQITLNDRLPNKVIYVLTEGVEFAASTSNNVTAQNLAAAINAWCPGVYATAFGAVVGLEKAPAMTNMAASLPANAPGLSIFNAGYGQTYLDGPVTTTYTISLQGDTIWPTGPTQAIDASNLNIDASLATAIQLSGASAVTVANIVGTPAPVAGKTLFLLFSDSNVTIPNNSTFALAAPYTGVAGGVLALRYDGSVWRELFRYPNFLSTPPALSTSTGTPGQYSYDSNYFYICVAANTWRRVAVASW